MSGSVMASDVNDATQFSPHRWWHAGRGYKHAFCLFCGYGYLEVLESDFADDPCPSTRASGGEEEAQRILADARTEALR